MMNRSAVRSGGMRITRNKLKAGQQYIIFYSSMGGQLADQFVTIYQFISCF